MWYRAVILIDLLPVWILKGPFYNHYYTDGSEGSNLTRMSKNGLSVSVASMFSGSLHSKCGCAHHACVWMLAPAFVHTLSRDSCQGSKGYKIWRTSWEKADLRQRETIQIFIFFFLVWPQQSSSHRLSLLTLPYSDTYILSGHCGWWGSRQFRKEWLGEETLVQTFR